MSLSEKEAVLKHLFLAFCLFGTICASMPESARAASAGGLQVSDKIELQSALLTFLEQGGDADGMFSILDRESGAMLVAHVEAMHPKIIRLGPDYVLCIEMYDDIGQRHDADFIMRKGSNGWILKDVLFEQRFGCRYQPLMIVIIDMCSQGIDNFLIPGRHQDPEYLPMWHEYWRRYPRRILA